MISASHITYYHLCHRKLWLHHRGMRMEDNSAAVAVGKLIGRVTYPQRLARWRELSLGHLKIDHFDPRTRTVREVKKSPKLEHAHIAQVKYYLYSLEKIGLTGAKGQIDYPKQRRTTPVELTAEDRQDIPQWEDEIRHIVDAPDCPKLIRKSYCRTCAFRDFCFV